MPLLGTSAGRNLERCPTLLSVLGASTRRLAAFPRSTVECFVSLSNRFKPLQCESEYLYGRGSGLGLKVADPRMACYRSGVLSGKAFTTPPGSGSRVQDLRTIRFRILKVLGCSLVVSVVRTFPEPSVKSLQNNCSIRKPTLTDMLSLMT